MFLLAAGCGALIASAFVGVAASPYHPYPVPEHGKHAEKYCIGEVSSLTPVFKKDSPIEGYSSSSFNVISFNNFYGANGDVQGRVLSCNNFDAAHFSIGLSLPKKKGKQGYTLVTGGSEFCFRSGSVFPHPQNGDADNGLIFTGHKIWSAKKGKVASGSKCTPFYIAQHSKRYCKGDDEDKCLQSSCNHAQRYYNWFTSDIDATRPNGHAELDEEGHLLKIYGPDGGKKSPYGKGKYKSVPPTRVIVKIDVDLWNAHRHTELFNIASWQELIIQIVEKKKSKSDAIFFDSDEVPHSAEKTAFVLDGSGLPVVAITTFIGSLIAPERIYNQEQGVSKGFIVAGDIQNLHQADTLECYGGAECPKHRRCGSGRCCLGQGTTCCGGQCCPVKKCCVDEFGQATCCGKSKKDHSVCVATQLTDLWEQNIMAEEELFLYDTEEQPEEEEHDLLAAAPQSNAKRDLQAKVSSKVCCPYGSTNLCNGACCEPGNCCYANELTPNGPQSVCCHDGKCAASISYGYDVCCPKEDSCPLPSDKRKYNPNYPGAEPEDVCCTKPGYACLSNKLQYNPNKDSTLCCPKNNEACGNDCCSTSEYCDRRTRRCQRKKLPPPPIGTIGTRPTRSPIVTRP